MSQRLAAAAPSQYDDPWRFCCDCVMTEDQASGQVRPFPSDLPYLRRIIEARQSVPILAVEKSRRMFVSWLFCALYLHDTLTQRHHANYVASRKLETSCELLGRLAFIHEHIDRDRWPGVPDIQLHAGYGGKGFRRIDCAATGSFVEAVAEGKDQLRQYTASNILLDEYGFWSKAEESWAALKPTTEGGGHIDVVSTPELGSYMYDLLYTSNDEGDTQ